jgi:N-acetylated-alpha-linked acidic dipeptidase
MVRQICLALFLLASSACQLRAQYDAQSEDLQNYFGFNDSTRRVEQSAEQKLQESITPARLDTIVRMLSSENRIAGSPADEHIRDYVVAELKKSGLDVEVVPYKVYLPYATDIDLELTMPEHQKFVLQEDQGPGERNVKGASYPWANGYTGTGSAEAQVVFVNYGLDDDYHLLDSIGVSVRGKIVIARYGRSYRGIKARSAEKHGAAGLLLYNDPANDGYVVGDIEPNGPMRPMDGIQRGSVYNGHGDPTTPGYASTENAPRISIEAAEGLVHIPVMPISAEIAGEILSKIRKGTLPAQSWQGGLPFRYHVGPAEASVKLSIKTDGAYRTIWNTIATVRGSELPDEWVIVGGHRDAWGPGAEDNGAGCAAVIAAAEAMSKLVKEGIRPRRSILFATWDAEEWGLLGSTEWVEDHEKELASKTILYVNEDECATGSEFSAGADPLLYSFLEACTRTVLGPTGSSVYDVWDSTLKTHHPQPALGTWIGLLGGGSDFTSFGGHVGIPSLEQGFGGPFGQYHSMHDSYDYVKHFGDSTFAYHATIAKLAAVEAVRMASAGVIDYNISRLAYRLRSMVKELNAETPLEWEDSATIKSLDSALQKMNVSGLRLKGILTRKRNELTTTMCSNVNAKLRSIPSIFASKDGIAGDSWVRNLVVSTDPDNGYADLPLPQIALSMRSNNEGKFQAALKDFLSRVRAATMQIDSIAQDLGGK